MRLLSLAAAATLLSTASISFAAPLPILGELGGFLEELLPGDATFEGIRDVVADAIANPELTIARVRVVKGLDRTRNALEDIIAQGDGETLILAEEGLAGIESAADGVDRIGAAITAGQTPDIADQATVAEGTFVAQLAIEELAALGTVENIQAAENGVALLREGVDGVLAASGLSFEDLGVVPPELGGGAGQEEEEVVVEPPPVDEEVDVPPVEEEVEVPPVDEELADEANAALDIARGQVVEGLDLTLTALTDIIAQVDGEALILAEEGLAGIESAADAVDRIAAALAAGQAPDRADQTIVAEGTFAAQIAIEELAALNVEGIEGAQDGVALLRQGVDGVIAASGLSFEDLGVVPPELDGDAGQEEVVAEPPVEEEVVVPPVEEEIVEEEVLPPVDEAEVINEDGANAGAGNDQATFDEIVRLINELRAAQGLAPLR